MNFDGEALLKFKISKKKFLLCLTCDEFSLYAMAQWADDEWMLDLSADNFQWLNYQLLCSATGRDYVYDVCTATDAMMLKCGDCYAEL